MSLDDSVDIVLYDSFAQPESDHDEIAALVANPRARRVVVYVELSPRTHRERPPERGPRVSVQDAAGPGVGHCAGGGARRRDGDQ